MRTIKSEKTLIMELGENYRTPSSLERLILIWMREHANEICTKKVQRTFGIEQVHAEEMLRLYGLNPRNDANLIRVR